MLRSMFEMLCCSTTYHMLSIEIGSLDGQCSLSWRRFKRDQPRVIMARFAVAVIV